MQYVLSLPATHDLEEIADYLDTLNADAGDRFLQRSNQRCQQLMQFPNLGRSYSNLYPNLRGLLIEGYIILYQVRGVQKNNVPI